MEGKGNGKEKEGGREIPFSYSQPTVRIRLIHLVRGGRGRHLHRWGEALLWGPWWGLFSCVLRWDRIDGMPLGVGEAGKRVYRVLGLAKTLRCVNGPRDCLKFTILSCDTHFKWKLEEQPQTSEPSL